MIRRILTALHARKLAKAAQEQQAEQELIAANAAVAVMSEFYALQDAKRRRDCRDIHLFTKRLREARTEQIRCEVRA